MNSRLQISLGGLLAVQLATVTQMLSSKPLSYQLMGAIVLFGISIPLISVVLMLNIAEVNDDFLTGCGLSGGFAGLVGLYLVFAHINVASAWAFAASVIISTVILGRYIGEKPDLTKPPDNP